MFVAEEAIFVKSEKCPYHVIFDLDLEHTLYVGSCGDHRVQVWWRSNNVCGRRSDFRQIGKVSVLSGGRVVSREMHLLPGF